MEKEWAFNKIEALFLINGGSRTRNKKLITKYFATAIVAILLFTAIPVIVGNTETQNAGYIVIENSINSELKDARNTDIENPENFEFKNEENHEIEDTGNEEAMAISYGSAMPLPLGSGISIWEAHAKGYAHITSSSDSISYIISNSGSIDIVVDEYAMIMSPNPYENGPEDPSGHRWAQDGVFTNGTITPGNSLTYNYGDYVVGGSLPYPPWWCIEDSELTAPNVIVTLTGEILPFDLWNTVNNPDDTQVWFDRGDMKTLTSATQGGIWGYLRDNPAIVVGKTPMWKSIPNLPTEVEIKIAATSIGFQNASYVVVKDKLPSGYQYVSGSASPAPNSITSNPDGSTDLTWNLGGMRCAIQTPDSEPTDYVHAFITYKMVTPELDPDSRYFLPRAQVDKNNDGAIDAHSEEPLLETYFLNRPPVAVPNNPTIDEGQTASLDGTQSYDLDDKYGDCIVSYEWDLDNDGVIDSTGQSASIEYGDDGVFPFILTVTDSYGDQGSTMGNITVLNVAPTVQITAQCQPVEVGIRVAGSKWSNVNLTLYEDDDPIGFIEVERWPGDPDNNPSYGNPTLPFLFNRTRIYKAVVTYDPYPDKGDKIKGDQPNNGKDKKDNAGNPVWIVLTTEDGTTTQIHHTFNTEQSKIKDSDHWNHVEPWEVELNGYLAGLSVTLEAIAYDPGADDLSFNWEFDDGTIITNDYPNSGGVYPVTATDTVVYSGPASGVTLTVSDDDLGSVKEIYSL